VQLTSLTCYPT